VSQKVFIFNYLDYRKFIRDSFLHFQREKGFSTRSFNQKAGIGSPSYLKSIVDGKRNISRITIRKLAMAFELSHNETLFFEKLVEFNHAVTTDDRNKAYQQLLKFKGYQQVRMTAKAEYDFFSKSELPILLEAIGTLWTNKSEKQMADALGLSTEKVKQAIRALEELKFLERKGTQWSRTEMYLETPAEAHNLNLRNYHQEMLERAKRALEDLPSEQRDFQSLLISVSAEKFQEMKKRTQEFVREMASVYGQEIKPTKVCQMSLQFFPIVTSEADT